MATMETGLASGISFALTAEQKELRALAREFAEKEIRPKAAEHDEHQTHPADIVAKAHELGLMNLHIPESLGGPELSAFDGMLVGEELNWGCSGIGTSIMANGLGAGPILIAGTDEQKREWLMPLVEEPILGCFGLSEPGAGSDVSGIQTTAVKRGRRVRRQRLEAVHHQWGPGVLDLLLRLDRQVEGAQGPDGVRDPDGRRRRDRREAPGQDGPAGDRHLCDRVSGRRRARVEPARRRGRRLQDRDADARLHPPGTAVGAVGVAQAAYELAVDYAKERVQFGMPIAMNQGVSFMVADMATEIEAARLLTWQAAWMIDQGYGRKATKYSSFAKRFAADTAMKVTTDAVQVFGGYGYIKEYPVEKLMRDAKLFQIYEGTSQIQRLVIAKEIFLSGDV